MAATANNLVEVEDLSLSFVLRNRKLSVLEGLTMRIAQGESVGLVGESGSGKSTLARSLLGLLPQGITRVRRGSIRIAGRDVTHLSQKEWEKIRGRPLAIIFQDPLSYLNPVMRIGKQIAEGVFRHAPELDVGQRVRELLTLVKLPEAVIDSYPHELSGGMRQRALLAVALGCKPSLLIADEPTTALDVTTQAEILELLKDLRERMDMSMLLISHDLGVVSAMCDRLYVMYAGQVMERGSSAAIFQDPAHPYTNGLLRAAAAVRLENGMFSTIPGDPPSLAESTKGCPFQPRCSYAIERCAEEASPYQPVSDLDPAHLARCWRVSPINEPLGSP
jgi:oligopeptide/dipeptide ABC transporter ATP-binding protein